MSLWFELHASSNTIGRLTVRRVTNLGVPPPVPGSGECDDMVSDYLVMKDGLEVGTVSHRYGDGAWELARAAMDMAVTPPGRMGARAAGRRLGVHESTIKNYASRGLLPFSATPGGHRRYQAADVDALRPLAEASRRRRTRP